MGAGCCISANLRNNTDMRQNGNSRGKEVGVGWGVKGVLSLLESLCLERINLFFDDDICTASFNYGRRSQNNIQVLLAGLILLFTVPPWLYGSSDMNRPHTCISNFLPTNINLMLHAKWAASEFFCTLNLQSCQSSFTLELLFLPAFLKGLQMLLRCHPPKKA